jgi:hypothetical protein
MTMACLVTRRIARDEAKRQVVFERMLQAVRRGIGSRGRHVRIGHAALRLARGQSSRVSCGTSSEPSSRSRYSAARTSSIRVIGVVRVRNTPISTSLKIGRPCSTEKQVIEAASMKNVPSVVPSVGACTRW